MSIVVVGGGAIGLLVAGRLARAGTEAVTLLARPSSVKALLDNELSITLNGVVATVPGLQVVSTPADLPVDCRRPDLAILCVKGYDTPGAITTLRELGAARTLTLQNGIGNEEILAKSFGAGQVISGAITTSVDLVGPSAIIVTKEGGIGLAPCGGRTADLEPWVAALTAAGFRTQRCENYRSMKWSKALLNMLGNASAAILGMSVAEVYSDRRLVTMERRAFREALAVMRRIGAKPLDLPSYPAALLARAMVWLPAPLLFPLLRTVVAGGRGGKDPSLLRDLRAGRRRSEGEFLYGAIAAEAARQSVPAPVNTGLWRILGGIAAGDIPWEEYRGKPEKLLAAGTR